MGFVNSFGKMLEILPPVAVSFAATFALAVLGMGGGAVIGLLVFGLLLPIGYWRNSKGASIGTFLMSIFGILLANWLCVQYVQGGGFLWFWK